MIQHPFHDKRLRLICFLIGHHCNTRTLSPPVARLSTFVEFGRVVHPKFSGLAGKAPSGLSRWLGVVSPLVTDLTCYLSDS